MVKLFSRKNLLLLVICLCLTLLCLSGCKRNKEEAKEPTVNVEPTVTPTSPMTPLPPVTEGETTEPVVTPDETPEVTPTPTIVPPVETYYNISFYMDDGYTKICDLAFKEGDYITYPGEVSKEANSEVTFIFTGWSTVLGGEVETTIIADKPMMLYANFLAIPIGKTIVTKPVASQEVYTYTGEFVKYEIADSEYYNVSGLYQTEVGSYKVVVSLKDRNETIWEDGTDQNLVFDFIIDKATNTWELTPTIAGWKVEEGKNNPSAQALFGDVTFTYSDKVDGVYTSEIPTEVGEYYMKAEVKGTDNYHALVEVVPFAITTDICVIRFFNVDNTLLHEITLNRGTNIVYDGDAFEKGNGNIVSEFIGWSNNDVLYTDLGVAEGNADFYATFEVGLNSNKGTIDNPYNFTTVEEFIFLSSLVNDGVDLTNKYFTLENDIDLTNTNLTSIGTLENPFNGTFNFKNYNVAYNSNHSLFGYNAGVISNLDIEVSITGDDILGGIASVNNGEISNSSVSGYINSSQMAGGVAGINAGRITNTKATAYIESDKLDYSKLVGEEGFGLYVGSAETNHQLEFNVSLWDGSSSEAFRNGNGSKNNPYLIENANQLAYLKNSIGSSNGYYKDVYFKLMTDIDLGNHIWSGIGTGQGTSGFAGSFDGNGHSIFGLKIESTNGRSALFNSTQKGSEIKNLTVYGNGNATGSYVALMVGINYANITNCVVVGTLTSNSTYSALMAAWNTNGNISDSKALGSIQTSEKYAGLLAGFNSNGVISTSIVGGRLVSNNTIAAMLVGYNEKNSISNCIAYGYLEGNDALGGIVGYNSKKDNLIGDITNCINYTNIVAKELSIAGNSSIIGVGGIAGLVGSDSTISDCVNYGSISTTSDKNAGIGGIVGNLYISIIENCENNGEISGVCAVGGIVGYGRSGGTVTNSVNNGTIVALHDAGGIVGENRSNIINCTNNGLVSESKEGSGYWIGGITGMSGSAGSISGCVNNGNVSAAGNSTGGIGGIVGGLYGSLTDCTNNGNVYGEINLGGIAGYVQNAKAVVKNSINNGSITTSLTSGVVNLGGIVGCNIGSVYQNHNYGSYVLPKENECDKYDYIVGFDEVGPSGVYDNINHYVND